MSESENATASPAADTSPDAGKRQFIIGGELWFVHEHSTSGNDTALVFESPNTARRVRDYPRNWRDLSDQELYSLSWKR